MNERFKQIRNHFNLTQKEFGTRLGVGRDTIANIENKRNEANPALIKLICLRFNIREDWLVNGNGEMFLENYYLSLDEYAEQNKMSDLEKEIFKLYLSIDKDTRKKLLSDFRNIILKADKEEFIYPDKEKDEYQQILEGQINKVLDEKYDEAAKIVEQEYDKTIQQELEYYRQELEAEKKAAISSVLENIKTRKRKIN